MLQCGGQSLTSADEKHQLDKEKLNYAHIDAYFCVHMIFSIIYEFECGPLILIIFMIP